MRTGKLRSGGDLRWYQRRYDRKGRPARHDEVLSLYCHGTMLRRLSAVLFIRKSPDNCILPRKLSCALHEAGCT